MVPSRTSADYFGLLSFPINILVLVLIRGNDPLFLSQSLPGGRIDFPFLPSLGCYCNTLSPEVYTRLQPCRLVSSLRKS
jgi:hypothetical protein